MAISTSMCNSFKVEILQGAHCFNAPVATTATSTSGNGSLTSVSTLAGVSVGMVATGPNLGANSIVTQITGSGACTISVNATTSGAAAVTFTGDSFYMALIKAASVSTYNATNSNYGDILNNTDEASGTNYTAGGTVLAQVTPAPQSTSVATTSFANATWTSATFSTIGCMIYNKGNISGTSTRLGGTSGSGANSNTTGLNRACGVFDFGGTQTVSAGTFTVVMPTNNAASAILRIQ